MLYAILAIVAVLVVGFLYRLVADVARMSADNKGGEAFGKRFRETN